MSSESSESTDAAKSSESFWASKTGKAFISMAVGLFTITVAIIGGLVGPYFTSAKEEEKQPNLTAFVDSQQYEMLPSDLKIIKAYDSHSLDTAVVIGTAELQIGALNRQSSSCLSSLREVVSSDGSEFKPPFACSYMKPVDTTGLESLQKDAPDVTREYLPPAGFTSIRLKNSGGIEAKNIMLHMAGALEVSSEDPSAKIEGNKVTVSGLHPGFCK